MSTQGSEYHRSIRQISSTFLLRCVRTKAELMAGIGLSLVNQLVKMHDGNVRLQAQA